MVEITKCPPGKAKGADDLKTWGHRRAAGQSGVPPSKRKGKKSPSKRAKSKKWWAKKGGRRQSSFEPAVTPRTDFSDMNVYDMSVMPWDENQVILERRPAVS